MNTKSILGDIRDEIVMEKIFSAYQPQIVLHAAAYKHVPMQEMNPWYAVLINVFGTKNIVQLSNKYNIE